MGIARSVEGRWKKIGVPPQTNKSMADTLQILRSLWKGETVSYSGPAGEYPEMVFADVPEKITPVHLAAVGPKTLALAGTHFDGVILHPFLTPHGVARSTAIVRKAAAEAGRDPLSVRIIAAVVGAPDLTGAEIKAVVYARASTYFVHKAMASPIIEANEWDIRALDPILAMGLEDLETQQVSLEEVRSKMTAASKLIPPHWISEGASVGSAATVARRLLEYKAAGADEILLHGAS